MDENAAQDRDGVEGIDTRCRIDRETRGQEGEIAGRMEVFKPNPGACGEGARDCLSCSHAELFTAGIRSCGLWSSHSKRQL